MIGITTGITSFLMETAIIYLYYLHIYLTKLVSFWIIQYVIWSGFLFISFHISFFIVKLISVNAIGSGLPEMKNILNGVIIIEYLSFKTLIAKIFGLIFVIGGGIVVGREGPFVHISSIIASCFTSIPIFRYIKNNETLHLYILTSAIAAGMASNFGAPIGGLYKLFNKCKKCKT